MKALVVTGIFTTLAVLSAIAATVCAYIFIIPESKRPKLNGLLKKVHDILNFKTLFLEMILKALYIFATALCICIGLFGILSAMFTYPSLALGYFALMIFGPIAVRISYELMMMFILLVKNVTDINKKMNKDAERKCPSCGVTVGKNESFCNNCGSKL